MPVIQDAAQCYIKLEYLRGEIVDTKRLKYFVQIAQSGSLTRASGVLRIAQPALSRQIRLLEEELGVPLFRRTARGMQLTEEGEYFKSAIAAPLRDLELAIRQLQSPDTFKVSLTVGLPQGLGKSLAPVLVKKLRQAQPNVHFRFLEGMTGLLIDWLNRGIIDLALLEEPGRNSLLQEEQLLALPLVVIGKPSKQMPVTQTVTLDQAFALPLILPSHHLGVRGVLDDATKEIERPLVISVEAESTDLILELCADGQGYSLMPEYYCRAMLQATQLTCWHIEHKPLILPIYIAARKNSAEAGNRFEQVKELIKETALAIH